MVMSRSNFPSLLVEGLREVYFNWLDMKSLVYPEIYEIRTSKKQKETDRTIAGIDMLSAKAEGEAIDYDDFVEGYMNALVKPQVINGENLSPIRDMVTLSKLGKALHEQRLSPVAA